MLAWEMPNCTIMRRELIRYHKLITLKVLLPSGSLNSSVPPYPHFCRGWCTLDVHVGLL